MDQTDLNLTSSSKLPVSRLPQSTFSCKKRVALEEANEQPPIKNIRLDTVSENLPHKAVAIVKPVEYKGGVSKNNKTSAANKIKRKSVCILNKNKNGPTKPVDNFRQPPKLRAPLVQASRHGNRQPAKKSIENISISRNSSNLDETKKIVRPGWDIKGRLADMESEMKMNKGEQTSLRNRLMDLERQNVKLEHTAQQKTQISQDAVCQIDEWRRKYDLKSSECEEINRKFNVLSRDKQILESELNSYVIKCQELTKNLAELSSTQISLSVQLDTTKVALNESMSKISILSERNRLNEEKNVDLECQLRAADEKNQKLEMLRRKLHNSVQELKGNIRVFCRVRPLLPKERPPCAEDLLCPTHILCSPEDPTKIEIIKDKLDSTLNESSAQVSKYNCGPGKRETKHEFEFDRVFDAAANQQMIFEEISQLIQSAIDGYNVCIFAYGQTGSGKTYTMQGPEDRVLAADPETAGIIPLAVRQIFLTAKELATKGWLYKLEASYLEIYNEKVRDLLTAEDNEEQNLEIKLGAVNPKGSKSTSDVHIPGLTLKPVENEAQIEDLITFAVAKRAMAATKCNSRSSRSHSVFRLRIAGSNSITGVTCDGLLSLVDLAGSERLKESQSEGDRLKEAQNINKSLSSLGQVITSLAKKDNHVPYRNSKLTFLLQNSLGGNSKTLMFVNISPNEEHTNETVNSLKFATNVNQCHIGSAYKKN